MNNYSASTEKIQAESDWKIVLKSYFEIALTNVTILIAIAFLSVRFLMPFAERNIGNESLRLVLILFLSLAVAAPFLWAFMAKRPKNLAYKELWIDKKYNHGPLLVIEIIRIVIGILFITLWLIQLGSTTLTFFVVVPLTIIVLTIFSKRIQQFYQRIENRFLTNLNARETAASKDDSIKAHVSRRTADIQSNLQPWDAHIVELEVRPEAVYTGKSLLELRWREQYGINIVYIKRGDKLITTPRRDDKLLPFDLVGVISTDAQLKIFKPVFDSVEIVNPGDGDINDIALQKILVDEHTKLKGLDIRSSGLRERTNGLVIGIERNQERILNPDSTTVFQWGDIIWIVGDRKKIQRLSHE